VGHGHQLHPDGPRLGLSRPRGGLVQPEILSWKLSITMDVSLCLEAVEEALSSNDKPEIFNTDQGNQFTSEALIAQLKKNEIAISMDGKGCWRDYVFVERIWRTIKYEEVYLRA
jgi:putative transposase